MSKTTTQLTSWRWRMANSNGNAKAESLPSLAEWTPVASFPSVVQMELLAQKLIPDPNIGENERLIQWAGAVDWEYACSFDSPKTADDEFADLVFEGLDTFATVTLNGKEVLRSDNMFIPHRVGVKEALRPAGERNELAILFESAEKIGAKLEKANGYLKCIMRDARRNHMRKAQYNWGWDWGPIVVTAGPYLPVSLESYGTRIDNVHIVPKLADDHKSASISTTITVSPKSTAAAATVDIVDAVGAKVATASIDLKDREQGSVDIKIDSPKLWWCNGQGEAHLYTAEVAITGSDSTILDKSSTRFGVRTIEVIQRPLDKEPGLTFMFRVNGRDIFAQGGDWIPADNMIPRITRQRYFDWAEVAKYCHLNMIRVWGGGIYETEDFFDACDENGLLVWHDMAFACTNTPVHDTFIESVRKEAEAQITRFRNRASLALICGGNEDFMLFDLEGIKYDHSDVTGPFDGQPFPQRKIYLDVLPQVAERLAPNVFYWANSPWGGAPANDPTIGDIHQWSVWHGEQKPYQEYKKLSGRLVSEFGMHGFPVQRTVDNFFPPDAPASVRHPQSRLVDCHNKGHGAHTRIARYLAENFRFDMTDLENFVYSSQLMQTEAYACAMRDWKRLFQGPGRELCAGAIIWQLNDCYPVTSWAFVDFFLRPKPAFYAIRRACAPVSVGVERAPATRWIDEDRPESKVPRFALFGHNTGPEAVECVLALRAYDFETGQWTELSAEDASRSVTLAPGRNTELGGLASQASWTEDSLVILEATLSDKSGNQLARAVDWPEPYRYLYWPDDTSVSVQVAPAPAPSSHSAVTAGGTGFFTDGGWEDRVTVSANHPVKGVWLEPVYDGSEKFDEYEPLWSDNMLDLMPGQEVGVLVKGLKGRKVKASFLADWEVKKGRE